MSTYEKKPEETSSLSAQNSAYPNKITALPAGSLSYIDSPVGGIYRRRVSYTRDTGSNCYNKIDWISGRISNISDTRSDYVCITL